jgi:hypothetical protein
MAAKTNKTKAHKPAAGRKAETGVNDTLLELFTAYEPLLGENLWPWETQRWTELVSCVLSASTKPEVAPESIREAAHVLEKGHLVDIDQLSELVSADGELDAEHPILMAVFAVLSNYGFSDEEIESAVIVLCCLADSIKKIYDGKIQKCLRKYGAEMLKGMEKEFAVPESEADILHAALAFWLQNAQNMPLPMPDEVTDWACGMLRTDYKALVRAADELDINVALLDNVLRSYWQQEIEIGRSQSVDA